MFNFFQKLSLGFTCFSVFSAPPIAECFDPNDHTTTEMPDFSTIHQTFTPWEVVKKGSRVKTTTEKIEDILLRYDHAINNTKRELGEAPAVRLFNTSPFRMVWIDLEMTGLSLYNDTILEIACVITENNLRIVAQTEPIVVHQPESVLNAMGPWCQEVHSQNGLINASLASDITLELADARVYQFLKKYTPKGRCCLAGNSVYFDRWFLEKYFPLVTSHLQPRIIDVSSVNELIRRWHHDIFQKLPRKFKRHRALDDILESIGELRVYKDLVFGKVERQLQGWTSLYDLTSTFEPTKKPTPSRKYPNRTRRTTVTTEDFWNAMLNTAT